MKIFPAFFILLFATNIYASNSFLVIADGEGNVPVSVKLDIKADYVAIPLSISSDEKNSARRLAKLKEAFNMIKERATKEDSIDIKKGAVSLSTEELSSFSISKSYNGSTVDLYVLGAIKDKGDVFSVTQKVIDFIETMPEIDDVDYRTGSTRLGILNPEQYRKELTKLIAEDSEALKSELGGFQSINISGIESPVLVRQRNGTEVTLYLPYRLSIEK